MPFKYKTVPRQPWVHDAVRLRGEGVKWIDMPEAVTLLYPNDGVFTVERIRGAVRATAEYQERMASMVVYEDKKEPTETDIETYFEALKAMNDAQMRLETKQTKATITIKEEKPFGIAFWGDWHIGVKGSDCRRLDEDADTIADTDGLYVIGMGDYKDNASALVHQNSTQESVATTDMQGMVVQHIWHRQVGKTLAIVRGCHDDWDKRNANVDFCQMLCDDTGAVNLWHGGVVTIKAGDQEYKIAARHKYKYESSLNTTNAQRNFMNDFGPCDVFMLAHKHFFDLQQTRRMGKDVIYGRSGSYKMYDEFGQKLAGYEGIYGVPVLIFFPTVREIIPVRSLDVAVDMLARLRA